MAAAAAPLVVEGLDLDLASLVGDRLVEVLAKVDPDGWDHPTTRAKWMVDLRRAALIEHGPAARFVISWPLVVDRRRRRRSRCCWRPTDPSR